MNIYHLDVITGYSDYSGLAKYEIKADGYEAYNSGYYSFWVRKSRPGKTRYEDEVVDYMETVASFPIGRTIITSIEYRES
jgi:hypothetical protein